MSTGCPTGCPSGCPLGVPPGGPLGGSLGGIPWGYPLGVSPGGWGGGGAVYRIPRNRGCGSASFGASRYLERLEAGNGGATRAPGTETRPLDQKRGPGPEIGLTRARAPAPIQSLELSESEDQGRSTQVTSISRPCLGTPGRPPRIHPGYPQAAGVPWGIFFGDPRGGSPGGMLWGDPQGGSPWGIPQGTLSGEPP